MSAFFPGSSFGAPSDRLPLTISSEPLPFVAPKDLKWRGEEGHLETAIVFGDPNESGPYGVLYKWFPGNFSKPHFHDQTRWGYVVSGTWWVSSASIPDISTTYPMPAGSVVVDLANQGALGRREGVRQGAGAGTRHRYRTSQNSRSRCKRESTSPKALDMEVKVIALKTGPELEIGIGFFGTLFTGQEQILWLQ